MTAWIEQLQNAGAVLNEQTVQHFANPQAEQQAAVNGTIVCDLSHLARVEAKGADTVRFLQGQLTNDIAKVSEQRSQLAAWCSVKGRVQVQFRVLQRGDAYYLLCPQDRLSLVMKRLSMYILRSDVKLRDASGELLCIGIGGTQAASALEAALGVAPPAEIDDALLQDEVSVLRIMGTQPRFMLLAAPERLLALWQALTAQETVTPAGIAAWELQDITAGLPQIMAATADEFLPQMLNLQAINGVSFKKGCYTGQEIVARTQYLGKLKKHLFIAKLATDGCPAPNTHLFADDGEQSIGQIVNARPHPDGGCLCQAVIQVKHIDSPIHVGSNDGTVLELQELPYELIDPTKA